MASMSNLIVGRQQELFGRFETIKRVCNEDGGTIAEDVMLGSIVEELDFLVELGQARLAEVSSHVL